MGVPGAGRGVGAHTMEQIQHEDTLSSLDAVCPPETTRRQCVGWVCRNPRRKRTRSPLSTPSTEPLMPRHHPLRGHAGIESTPPIHQLRDASHPPSRPTEPSPSHAGGSCLIPPTQRSCATQRCWQEASHGVLALLTRRKRPKRLYQRETRGGVSCVGRAPLSPCRFLEKSWIDVAPPNRRLPTGVSGVGS